LGSATVIFYWRISGYLRDAMAKPNSVIDNALAGQDDGERNFDDCGRS
jgi:hypothetical protein